MRSNLLNSLLSRFDTMPVLFGSVFGISMVAASLVWFAVVLVPKQKTLEKLQRENAHIAWVSSRTSKDAEIDHALQGQLLQIPVNQLLSEKISQLNEISSHYGLDFMQSKIHLEIAREGAGISHWRIGFPLIGAYLQVREFLVEIAQTMPELVLVALHISRKQVDDAQLDVQLEFRQYFSE